MNTKTQSENRPAAQNRNFNADSVMGFAVLGCLAAGSIGLVKALNMQTGLDVLLCLLGSVTAFGTVFYIYFGK
jgi:hypothetical protein